VNPSSWKHDCLLVAGRWLSAVILCHFPAIFFSVCLVLSSGLDHFVFPSCGCQDFPLIFPLPFFFTPSYEMICSIDSHNPKCLISCRPTQLVANQFGFCIWQWMGGGGGIRSSSAGDLIDEWMSWLCTVRFWRPSLLFVETRQVDTDIPPPCPLVAWRSPVQRCSSCQVAAQSLCYIHQRPTQTTNLPSVVT